MGKKKATLQKPWKQEGSRVKYLECLKEKNTNLVFATLWNYPSELEEYSLS